MIHGSNVRNIEVIYVTKTSDFQFVVQKDD